jgi:hypothetical protein
MQYNIACYPGAAGAVVWVMSAWGFVYYIQPDILLRLQFFLDFFSCYRVFGCFSATGIQKHYKQRFAKTWIILYHGTWGARYRLPTD